MLAPRRMVEHPRWADMCARILHQCEFLRGGKENLARFLEVPETDLEQWLSARGGPPRAVFERAMELILAEHDRRSALERAGKMPKRRHTDH